MALSEEWLIEDLKQVFLRLNLGETWEQLRGKERTQRRRALGLMLSASTILLLLAIVASAASYSFLMERDLTIEAARRLSPLEADMALRPSLALPPSHRLALVQSNIGSQIGLSLDERYLVTYGAGNTAYVWRTQDGSRMGSIVQDSEITSASFSTEGDLLVTADRNGSVWLHRLPALDAAQRLPFSTQAVWFAPDGILLTLETRQDTSGSVFSSTLR